MSDSQSPSPVIRSARVMVYDGPLGRISVEPHPTTGTIQPVGAVTITWCQIDFDSRQQTMEREVSEIYASSENPNPRTR